ncbi:sensor domain-containing protein [Pseudomonas borbori]
MKKTTLAPLNNIVDLMLDAICVVDKEGHFVFVSAACERIFGYTADEMIGKVMIDMVHPDDRARTLQAAGEVMSGSNKPNFENRYIRKNGETVHIMWSARWSDKDQLRIAVAHDISDRKRNDSIQAAIYAISEAALTASNLPTLFQRIHLIVGELLPALNFSVALYDRKTDELSFPYHVDLHHQAPAPHKLDASTLGAEIIKTGQTLLLSPETLTKLPEHLRSMACDSLYWLGVPLNSHQGTIGALIVQSYSAGAPYTDKDKELLQFVSTQVAAAIERQQMMNHLTFMAQYDQLTQLPNRAMFHDRLVNALARARREQSQLSLLFLDLDKFKQVNDTLGHASGDLLLQLVAQRLRQCVRESDTVARFAGDEFVVLVEHFHSCEQAILVAEKIRRALNEPFDLNGHHHLALPSIGIALYPEHGADEQQLLNQADKAMYQVKKNGGNRYQIASQANAQVQQASA